MAFLGWNRPPRCRRSSYFLVMPGIVWYHTAHTVCNAISSKCRCLYGGAGWVDIRVGAFSCQGVEHRPFSISGGDRKTFHVLSVFFHSNVQDDYTSCLTKCPPAPGSSPPRPGVPQYHPAAIGASTGTLRAAAPPEFNAGRPGRVIGLIEDPVNVPPPDDPQMGI